MSLVNGILGLLSDARELEQGDAQVAQRLTSSVIRPLENALTRVQPNVTDQSAVLTTSRAGDEAVIEDRLAAPLDERLWQLALEATTLGLQADVPIEVKEAIAALQDLACQFAPTDGPLNSTARVATLKSIQAQLPIGIDAEANGPYLVTNAEILTNWLGERIPTRPQMALCRCGGSQIKPLCDGTHARIGFTDGKDPKRVVDRVDTYAGQQVTVLDNRGTCAHSGFCTDRLASVFHLGSDPFVTPSGARMDEIIRAVRTCPSGALSYAVDGREAREQVETKRQPAIEVSKDGPYRVTGAIRLADGHGAPEPRNQGASFEHYSLCRCGHSQNKPFCSGMHWYVNFHDPLPDPEHAPNLFEWAGGLPALTRLTRIFYAKYVPDDPLVGPLFANMAPDHAERVAAWLGEVFGGPKNYSEQYGGYVRMISQHVGKGITETQRARWVSLLCQSANDAGLPADPEFRAAFVAYLEWGSRLAVENSQQGARPPAHMPMPRWWWTCDATPGSRVSALAPQAPEPEITLPSPDEPLSFARHIKPLFRQMDRQSMTFAFDLWAYADVKTHGQAILDRLQKGTMPCDGAWPRERVDTFRRWIESGTPE